MKILLEACGAAWCINYSLVAYTWTLVAVGVVASTSSSSAGILFRTSD